MVRATKPYTQGRNTDSLMRAARPEYSGANITRASSVAGNSSSREARGGVEAVDGVGLLILFLPANGFVAPAGIARHAAPGNAGADADRHRAAKPESGRPQARLHPRGADVAKAVDYRVDDILCLVAAALLN